MQYMNVTKIHTFVTVVTNGNNIRTHRKEFNIWDFMHQIGRGELI